MPERLRLKSRDIRGHTAIAAPGTGYYLYFESWGGQLQHGVSNTWTALGVLRELDWLYQVFGARRAWVVPA